MINNIKIKSQDIAFPSNHTQVDQVIFTNGDESEHKYNIVRRKQAIVLLIHTNTDKIAMIKQYRIAVGETLQELVAGQIEKWEDKIKTAQKEALEEAGYDIKSENIHDLWDIYTSSGFTDERLTLMVWTDAEFVGRIDSHEASESIEKLELTKEEFVKWYKEWVMVDSIKESKIDAILLRGSVKNIAICRELLYNILKE